MTAKYALICVLGLFGFICSVVGVNFCQNSEYLDGNWIYNNLTRQSNRYSHSLNLAEFSDNNYQSTLRMLTCCQTSNDDEETDVEFLTANKNILLPAFCHVGQPNHIHNPKTNRACCNCVFNNSLRVDVAEREKWEWKPKLCHMMHFEANPFCKLLGKRTIQFVGDSLTQSTFDSLVSLIRAGGEKNWNCSNQLMYGRSHYLHFSNKRLHHSFNDYVLQNNPDIVIMNAGAHLHDRYELRNDILPQCLRLIDVVEKENMKRGNKKKIKYFFRSQYGGHMNCWLHKEPLQSYNNTLALSLHNETTHKNAHGWYNWHLFPEYDKDCRKMLKNNPKMQFLDVSPLYLRADAHVGIHLENDVKKIDCLHYAMPGAMDLTARLIYHKMFVGEM